MRSKQAKICSLILATAVSSIFSTASYTAKAVTEKNNIIYVTNKDVKNGKVVISNKTAQSIVIKKSVKKATIQLKGVKLSSDLTVEKGDYVLKTSRTKIKSLKISGKNTNIKLDKSSDLNKRNFVLKIAKNTTGNLDLSELGKKVTAELGKNSDINITVGNNDKASVVIKKASITSKLGLVGTGEGASISKIRVESPVKLTVKVNATILETVKKADKAEIAIESKVAEVKNEAGALVQDKEAERQKAEKEKEEKAREEKAKEDKAKEEKLKEEKAREANNNAGGSYTPGITEKKATAIALSKEGGELDEDGKAITIKVAYTPADATNKNLDWAIKEGSDKVRIISSNSNEAKIEALDNGAYKIEAKVKGSDVKAEMSGNVTNQGDKAFEKRIDEYLKFTEAKINKDNYEDIKKMGADIVVKIDEKIGATSGTEKAKWEAKKNEVSLKKNVLDAAIDVIKGKIEEAKTAITNEYNKIKTGKPVANTAKEAVRIIEEKRKELSEKDFKAVVTDTERYNKIKAEVDKIKDLIATTLTVDESGVARIGVPQNAELNYKIIHTHTSKGAVVANTIKAEGTVAAGKESFSLLNELRKTGLGWYKVVVYKKMNDIEDFTVADTYNIPVKVQLLENTLGKLEINSLWNIESDTSNGKVKIDFANRKLIWQRIDNADYYDISAEIFISGDYNLGKYVLEPTGEDIDFSNVENEFNYSEFQVEKFIVQNHQPELKKLRRLVDKENTSMEVSLDKFLPHACDFTGSPLWKDYKNTPMTLKINIIPRKKNALFVSDMENMIKVKGSNNNVFIDSVKVGEFYEKFYGQSFPTTP